MSKKWLGIALLIAILIAWMEKYFIIIVIIILLLFAVRLLADLVWWYIDRDK